MFRNNLDGAGGKWKEMKYEPDIKVDGQGKTTA